MEKLFKQINLAKLKIENLRAEDSLVLPIFTDLHTDNVAHKDAQKIIEVLKLITREIDVDAVINLGDNVSMLGRRLHITNDELKKVMEDLFSAIYEAVNRPLIMVHGNHDAIGTDFFKPDFWNGIVKNKFGVQSAEYSASGSYYYLDCEKAKTRLVILSIPSESDLEAEHPTPVWAFGESQLKWLKDIALDTENNVIIISHVPLYYSYNGGETRLLETWNGEKVTSSHYADLCGWIEDRDEAAKIIEAFNGKSGAKVIACLSGHTHKDSLWMPFEEKDDHTNPLPCHQVVTGRACPPECESSEFGVSVDIAVWTPSKNEFNLIRIGDGEDREIIF